LMICDSLVLAAREIDMVLVFSYPSLAKSVLATSNILCRADPAISALAWPVDILLLCDITRWNGDNLCGYNGSK